MSATILIVEDEKHTREGLFLALEDNYTVELAASVEEGLQKLEKQRFDIVLTDLRMGTQSGMKIVDAAVNHPTEPLCIMMTAFGSVPTAVEAVKRGAFDFLPKPIQLDHLEAIIAKGLRSRHSPPIASPSVKSLASTPIGSASAIIGKSPAIRSVCDLISRVAPSNATVLISGETGTGKELVAQQIHAQSPRHKGPFVAVNCAALSENLLESELFGHEKGAFTGAANRRIGRFEAANRGTLFLDEIGEISQATQVKLLRFLETKSFERVGSQDSIKADVRLVCATHRNLKQLVEKGIFREDLYYRLNVVTIAVPPLRDRRQDISLLIDYYLRYFAQENSKSPLVLGPGILKRLQGYPWPGNIRELRNVCEHACVLVNKPNWDLEDLDSRFHASFSPSTPSQDEKSRLADALKQAAGNRTKAAEILGVSRRTLHRKLLKWPDIDIS